MLEEPPQKTLFLLVAEEQDELLPTIVSRCQKVKVGGLARNEDAETIVATIISQNPAAGYIEKMQMAEAFYQVLSDWKTEIGDRIKEEEAEQAESEEYIRINKEVLDARIEAEYKEKRTNLMRALAMWHRDIFFAISGVLDTDLFYYQDFLSFIRNTAENIGYQKAYQNIELVEDMQYQMNLYISEQSVLQRGFTDMSL